MDVVPLPTFDLEATEDPAVLDNRDLALQIDTFAALMPRLITV